MPITSTPTTTTLRRTLFEKLPDLRPTTFRVVLAICVFLITVLLHLQLSHEGLAPMVSTGSVLLSALLGLLAYWLAQSLVMFLILFCPLVTAIALGLGLYGWFKP